MGGSRSPLPADPPRTERTGSPTSAEPWRLARHDDWGAEVSALEQVGRVGVMHAEAAARGGAADGIGRVGAVDAILAPAQVHGADAERIVRSRAHHLGQPRVLATHACRRPPTRVAIFGADPQVAGPLELRLAHGDRVAHRLAV